MTVFATKTPVHERSPAVGHDHVVADISLAGWLLSSSDTAAPYTVFFAVMGLILLSAGIVVLHRRIERRIVRIKEL